MQSKAATVKEYIEQLPSDRRAAIQAVRKVILANLDKAYEEGMQYGMIGDGQPPSEHAKWFQSAWAKSGKKLDMGKSCIRFKKIDDLALDVIGEAIKRMPAKGYIAGYEAALAKIKGNAKPVVKKALKGKSTKKKV